MGRENQAVCLKLSKPTLLPCKNSFNRPRLIGAPRRCWSFLVQLYSSHETRKSTNTRHKPQLLGPLFDLLFPSPQSPCFFSSLPFALLCSPFFHGNKKSFEPSTKTTGSKQRDTVTEETCVPKNMEKKYHVEGKRQRAKLSVSCGATSSSQTLYEPAYLC
jgi:hypothetical protein